MVFVSGLEDLVLAVVRGELPGLQYRLLDLSTGHEHSFVYNFPRELIMRIKDSTSRQQWALISRQMPVQLMVRDAALLAGGLDVHDGLRAYTEKEPWIPVSSMLRVLVTGGFVFIDGYVSVQGTLLNNVGFNVYPFNAPFESRDCLLHKGIEPEMNADNVAAARRKRDVLAESVGISADSYQEDDAAHEAFRTAVTPVRPPAEQRWTPGRSWATYASMRVAARGERVLSRSAIQPPLPQVSLDQARTICRTVVQQAGGEAHKRVSAALALLLAYDEGLDHGLEIRKTKKALAQGVDVFIFDKRHDWEFVGGHEVRPKSFTLSKIIIASGQDAQGVAQVTLRKSHDQGRFTGRGGWAYALVQRVDDEEDEFEFVSPVRLFIVRD